MSLPVQESKSERITLTCTPTELAEVDFVCAVRNTDRASLLRASSLEEVLAEAIRLRTILNNSAA